jgi:hypothetical protein
MDFKDNIKQIAERIEKLKENIQTEEATKNAFIMPFINALGYDVFNPLEVIPEMVCDIGTKKGEKIDYAIMKDNEPIILIECKHWKQDLNLHDNQLLRYFGVSKAKFGLLTNGIIYRFYTDLKQPNVMDDKPFLEVDLTDIKENQIEELKKFHKSYFNIDSIISSASELKYMGELKTIIKDEFANPSVELVKLLASRVYDGSMRQTIIEQFTPLVKKSLASHVSDIISERLKGALSANEEAANEEPQPMEEIAEVEKINTTDEELESFQIVKAILRKVVEPSRITYRDTQTYFAILLDDNVRKTICRMYFNRSIKYVCTIPEPKKEEKHRIESLDDIFQLEQQLLDTISMYENK